MRFLKKSLLSSVLCASALETFIFSSDKKSDFLRGVRRHRDIIQLVIFCEEDLMAEKMEMETAFEIVTPDTIHETDLEILKIVWALDFPVKPLNANSNQNTFKYYASQKHICGYAVNNPCEWCIQVNPYYTENGKRYISVYIWVHKFLRKDKPKEKQSVHAMYQFELWCKGQSCIKFSSIHKFTEKKPCYGFKKCIPFPKPTVDSYPEAETLPQMKISLGINAQIMIIRDIKDFVFPSTIEDKCLLCSDGNSSAESVSPSPLHDEAEMEKRRKLFFVNHAIKDKVSEMRKTGDNADVIIRAAKKEHRAHMNVLIARCNSSQIPFKTETINGAKMKIIEMKEVLDYTVSDVLDYCYDDYSKHFTHYKRITPILQCANKFQMPSLKNQCLIELACCLIPKYFFHTVKSVLEFTGNVDEETSKTIISFLRRYYTIHHVEIREAIKLPHMKNQSLHLIAKLFII